MAEVVLENVSVDLPIYNPRGRALKNELLRRAVGARVDRADSSVTVVQALRGLNLHVSHGERVGLIGKNGAGKTTLLRVLARIFHPTRGTASISGRVSALLDLTAGMDPEATGYENIILRGVVLGLSPSGARAIVPDVEEFTELGEYLSLPIRTYSSGMMLRLAFAVSTAVQPDIVILDELIGVGDAEFSAKAFQRVNELIEKSSMLFLASHNNVTIRQFCTRTLLLDDGAISLDGPTEQLIVAYEERSRTDVTRTPAPPKNSDDAAEAAANYGR